MQFLFLNLYRSCEWDTLWILNLAFSVLLGISYLRWVNKYSTFYYKKFQQSELFFKLITRRVPLVGQELLTLLEFTPVFSGVRVTRSLFLYVCFVDRCLSFCPFSLGNCVVGPSSIDGFWLPLWYLQTLLLLIIAKNVVNWGARLIPNII